MGSAMHPSHNFPLQAVTYISVHWRFLFFLWLFGLPCSWFFVSIPPMYQCVTWPIRRKPVILMRPTRLYLRLSVLCVFCPCLPCCLPALSNPVLTGELLKTAIGYTVLLPNYQICTVYKVHATYPINHFLSYINVTNALYPCYLFGIKTYVSYVSYVSALCDTFIKLAFQQMEEI